MITGDQIRALRARLGLTQAAFCERFGVPINTLRHWELRGVSHGVPPTMLRLIASAPETIAALLSAAPRALPPAATDLPPRRRSRPFSKNPPQGSAGLGSK